MKDFHTGRNSQSGASLVMLLVGLALSAIGVAAASAFFIQSNVKAKAMMGESESVSHLALLLKQSFNHKHCLKLDIYKGKFKKNVGTPEILSDETPARATPKGGANASPTKAPASAFNPESLSVIRNSIGKSYDISRVQMVQRTGVIGTDPGRVLADLRLEVVLRAQVAKRDKEEATALTVPLLLDVDQNFLAVGCMQSPQPADLCKKNNGTFNDKSTSTLCHIKKR